MSGIPPNNNPFPLHSLGPHFDEGEERKSNEEKEIENVVANAMEDVAAAAHSSTKKRRVDVVIDPLNDIDKNVQNKAARTAEIIKGRKERLLPESTVEEQKEEGKTNEVILSSLIINIEDALKTASSPLQIAICVDSLKDFMASKIEDEELIIECLTSIYSVICQINYLTNRTVANNELSIKLTFLCEYAERFGNSKFLRISWLIYEILEMAAVSPRPPLPERDKIHQAKVLLVQSNLDLWQKEITDPQAVEGGKKACKIIHEAIFSCQTDICLSNCVLTSLPKAFWLSSVEELDLSHNRMTTLGDEDADMDFISLNLSHNHLKQLPEGIYFLSGLRTLILDDNPLLSSFDHDLETLRFLNTIGYHNTAIPDVAVRDTLRISLSDEDNQTELSLLLHDFKEIFPEIDFEPIELFPPYLQGQLCLYAREFSLKVHLNRENLTPLIHFLTDLMADPSNREIFLLLVEYRPHSNSLHELPIDLGPWQKFNDRDFLVEALQITPAEFRLSFFYLISKALEEKEIFYNAENPAVFVSEDYESNLATVLDYLSSDHHPQHAEIRNAMVQKMNQMGQSDRKGTLPKEQREHNFQYANQILRLADLLDYESDSLRRRLAEAVFAAFDPELEKNLSHPYTLFDTLNNLYETESLDSQYPIQQLILIDEGIEVIHQATFNLAHLRKRVNQTLYTIEDLPLLSEELGLDYFFKLFSQIKHRLVTTNNDAKNQVKDYLCVLFEINLENIQEVMVMTGMDELSAIVFTCESASLGEGKRLPELLTVSGDQKTVIEDSQFYVISSLKALEEESNQPSDGQFFSPRELQALKFLNIVRTCGVGQEEEITSYFNSLAPKYRGSRIAPVGEMAKVQRLCDNVIQLTLDEIINRQSFLDEATKTAHVSQQVHQKRFLKNRLAHQIGLRHSIEFDEGSSTISHALLETLEPFDPAKPEEPINILLNKFYQLFTPQILLHALRTKIIESAHHAAIINQELKTKLSQQMMTPQEVQIEKMARYRAENLVTEQELTNYLTESGIAISVDGVIDWNQYLIYNEDYTEFKGLTDLALFALMKKEGILMD